MSLIKLQGCASKLHVDLFSESILPAGYGYYVILWTERYKHMKIDYSLHANQWHDPIHMFYWRTSRSSWHLFVRMWVVKQLLMRSLMFIESNHSMRHPLYWYLGEIWASDVEDGVDRGLGLRWLNGFWWLCDIRGNWNRLKWALSLRFEIPDHSLSDLGQISIRLMSIRRQVNTATIQLSIG